MIIVPPSGRDDTAALQAALDTATDTCDEVQIKGTYVVTAPIRLTGGSLRGFLPSRAGDWSAGTEIHAKHGGDVFQLVYRPKCRLARISDLGVSCYHSKSQDAACIHVMPDGADGVVFGPTLDNLVIDTAGVGILLDRGVMGMQASNLNITSARKAGILAPEGWRVSDNHWHNIYISGKPHADVGATDVPHPTPVGWSGPGANDRITTALIEYCTVGLRSERTINVGFQDLRIDYVLDTAIELGNGYNAKIGSNALTVSRLSLQTPFAGGPTNRKTAVRFIGDLQGVPAKFCAGIFITADGGSGPFAMPMSLKGMQLSIGIRT